MATRSASGRSFAGGRLPVLVTGLGLGAFLDGIVLHQILQWHHLIEAWTSADDLAGLQANTFWDGVFHLVAWAVVVVGLVWTWDRRDAVRAASTSSVAGMLLIGWGMFNLIDQVVFHMILGAHHIRMVHNYLVYDLAFTGIGIALIGAGLSLRRRRGIGS